MQKGYRVFDHFTQKVLHSRNVKFDERESGIPQFESEKSVQQPLILHQMDETEYNDGKNVEGNGTSEESSTLETQPQIVEVPPRRSTRERRLVDYYGFSQAHIIIHHEPTTFEEATSCPEKSKWTVAMEKEMESLKENTVWELTTLPPGKKAISSKWVYKVKTNSDSSIECYKARFVARGFQRFGSDYDETFCPVVCMESLRTLIALSTQCGLELHHVDVHTAFRNGTLQEEGYEMKGKEQLVCKLQKSIYGLKQSSRCWNVALESQLRKMGFTQSKFDPCIYMSVGENTFYMSVYVDDMILAGKDEAKMKSIKEELSSRFDIKDLGKLSYFLGMSIIQNKEENKIWMGQPMYTEKILTKMDMDNCKPVKTPVDPGNRLVKATEDKDVLDQQSYQSLVGSLVYLATCTRPDIAYAVGTLARFGSKPNQSHWTAAKRVLRYLKGTSNFGILFRGNDTSAPVGYSNADWAGDREDRKSTSGYIFCIAGGPVSWRSKKQDTVSISTAEAEYVALSSACTGMCMDEKTQFRT